MVGSKRKSRKNTPKKGVRITRVVGTIAAASLVLAGGYYWLLAHQEMFPTPEKIVTSEEAPSQKGKPAFTELMGRWRRPDGGYVLDIRGVEGDGGLDAAYYNPRPINVAEANATREGGTLKIFIELRDQGYPGATYQLLYHPVQQALSGVYYQPTAGGTFQVIFTRME